MREQEFTFTFAPRLRGRVPVRRYATGVPALAALLAVALLVTGCGGASVGHTAVTRLPQPIPSGPGGDDGQPGPGAASPGGPIGNYLARLPQFPPAPAPTPVIVPPGPLSGWYTHIPTTQRVAFLTIDDGWIKRPEALELVARAHVPVTLFLAVNAIRDNVEYFRTLQAAGAMIEAHTISHPSLTGKPYALQRTEICGSADWLGQRYGRRPVLFRPPFGNKDATTLRAVRDCGLKAAFYWTETVDKGKVRYQRGHTIQPGDIILMHFRPAFADDFLAALTAIHKAGLTPAVLGDYIR